MASAIPVYCALHADRCVLEQDHRVRCFGPKRTILATSYINSVGSVTDVRGWLVVNRKKIEEVTFEKSGRVITYRTRHTLYSIPMQYWGLIGLAIYFGFTAYRSFR
jgi:hypothetical protein